MKKGIVVLVLIALLGSVVFASGRKQRQMD